MVSSNSPRCFEVLKKSRDRLIGSLGMDLVLGHVGMLVPLGVHRFISVVHLDESHAAFSKSACHEALPTVGVGGFFSDAIHLFGRFGFVGEIENVGGIHLHAKGEIK